MTNPDFELIDGMTELMVQHSANMFTPGDRQRFLVETTNIFGRFLPPGETESTPEQQMEAMGRQIGVLLWKLLESRGLILP